MVKKESKLMPTYVNYNLIALPLFWINCYSNFVVLSQKKNKFDQVYKNTIHQNSETKLLT